DDEFPSLPPVTMGHEVTGEVRSVGEGVDAELIGGRFAAETYFSYCETCTYCRTGSPNLCQGRRSFGSHVDGGFARWLILPARNLHRLPDHVARHAGSLAEPLACVTNCLFDPPVVNAGDSVLVLGPGTMGVLTAQAARAAGGTVVLAGLPSDEQRLAVAAQLGLATITVGDEPILEETFDVVCECSGAQPAAATALSAVRKGGRYVHVGIFGHEVTLDLD
ncbi:MAG: alcohol dehydrogenase catalytic domain-containing protein, partial [Acidimicrobiia bacterium]